MPLAHDPPRPVNVLGVNAVFHDPAAALVVDGEIVAAAEEERFSRRKHGKPPVAFSTWELPEQAMAWCLDEAGPRARPTSTRSPTPTTRRIAVQPDGDITVGRLGGAADAVRAARAAVPARPRCPGSTRRRCAASAHHVAHAASATFASGFDPCSVLVLDGRGETRLAPRGPRSPAASWTSLAAQRAPALARPALRGADRRTSASAARPTSTR